jgi:hemerythrin
MDHISWTEDLAVGVKLVDEQHQQFFKAANNLAEAMWEGRTKEEIGKTLDFLADYAIKHFQDEESLMGRYSYPELPAQQRAHVAFNQQMKSLQDRYRGGESASTIAIELLNGACDWFRQHIRTMDKPMGQYVQGKL